MEKEDFYSNIDGWISKPKESWNHITLMAYFCHKYENVNGVRFRMAAWKGDPGKSKESRDFSKLFRLFTPDDYKSLSKDDKKDAKDNAIYKIYNYINWMFDHKFRSGEKSVTGTGIFILPAMINEFERMYSSFLKKNSNMRTFDAFLKWCEAEASDIFNMHQLDDIGDLKMLDSYYKASDWLKAGCVEEVVLGRARDMGLL